MRVRDDRKADAVTLILSDATIEDSGEIAEGIVADHDTEGRVVGIEVFDASKRTSDTQERVRLDAAALARGTRGRARPGSAGRVA